jgi:hypothetical protein
LVLSESAARKQKTVGRTKKTTTSPSLSPTHSDAKALQEKLARKAATAGGDKK